MKNFVYCVAFLQILVFSKGLPPIPKCKLADSQCLKSAAPAALKLLVPGIPEIDTEPLDVMFLNQVDINLAGLNMVLKNLHVKGFGDTVFDKISVDTDKKKIKLVLHIDKLVITGKYKASGMLLILPISGDGDFTVKLKNLELEITFPFDLKKNSHGKDIIDLKSFSYKYNVKDNLNFHLTNLFNGNKELSETLLKFMNENWKILSEEFGQPLVDAGLSKIHVAIKKYLKSQPLEEIAIL